MQLKICHYCGKEKQLDEFVKDKSRLGGYCNMCKQCRNERKRNIIRDKKFCIYCLQEKDLNEFNNHKNSRDGKSNICKECQSILRKEYHKNNKERERDNNRKWHQNNHLRKLIRGRFVEARRYNIPYGTINDLFNYLKTKYDECKCECCGKKLVKPNGIDSVVKDNSFSIDRIIPQKGYVIGNVAILCWRCNVLKKNSTWQEHMMIANWQKEREENII